MTNNDIIEKIFKLSINILEKNNDINRDINKLLKLLYDKPIDNIVESIYDDNHKSSNNKRKLSIESTINNKKHKII